MNGKTRYQAPALKKGLEILELLASASGPLNMTDISAALGRSVSEKGSAAAVDLRRAAAKRGLVSPPPKSSGPGKYILIGLGVVAVAAIAYAAYQTLRADDDLWIDDEVDEADVEVPSE